MSTLLNMDEVKIDPLWALAISSQLALRRQVLPFAEVGGVVQVAVLNDRDSAALQALKRQLGRPIEAERADPASLRRALQRVYQSVGDKRDGDDATSLCDRVLSAAVIRQASDIHIDPGQNGISLRFRVDGRLEFYKSLEVQHYTPLLSRFKVLSGMDIAEKRAPQDGRFSFELGAGERVELRTATLPTKYGERMTLRLLALQTESLTLANLGLSDADRQRVDEALRKPHGMILVTGPTGSGKSTTLYAALRRLMEGEPKNIITIEDPIEYDIDGVAQVEVDSADKVNFSRALRSVLRHDPDVVMIGEIRDAETADVANKAALTGHLVFSTLHTNSAASVVTRLIDMGVDRYLIGATLRIAAAQRLVRRLCERCRRERILTEAEAGVLGRPEWAGTQVFQASGCKYCAGRGTIGRLGVFEIINFDDVLARRVVAGADELALLETMKQRQLPSLLDDALAKLKAGLCHFEDVVSTVTAW